MSCRDFFAFLRILVLFLSANLALALNATSNVTSMTNTSLTMTTMSMMTSKMTTSSPQSTAMDNTTIIYTIGGNAGGDPCLFPFTFMGVSYSTCTTAGRSDNLQWCATTSNYAKDYIWGICPKPVDGCGEFWFEGQFGKYCYQFNLQSALTWVQARDACRQQNADLLSIESPMEQGWIAGRISIVTTVMWLGMSDITVEGNWAWSDGKPLTYLNWREGQPNSYGGNEDCGAIITRNGLWGDTPCSRHLSFICKKLDETKAANFATTAPAPNTTLAVNQECYIGDGTAYMGSVNVTAKGKMCDDWSTRSVNYGLTGTSCRNPDHSLMPWCYAKNGTWEYCDVPLCTVKKFCPTGWYPIGKRCFQLGCTIPSTWQQAQLVCKKLGANVIRIASKLELDQVLVWMKQVKATASSIWIGMNDIKHEMQFVWDDGVKPTFTNWGKQQPDDVKPVDDCVAMNMATGLWNVTDCAIKRQYICSKPASETISPNPDTLIGICTNRGPSSGGNSSGPPLPSPPTQTVGCPTGWYGFGTSCYKFEDLTTNWTVAYAYCISNYGSMSKMIAPKDRFQQAFLSSRAARYADVVSFHLNILAIKSRTNNWHFFDTNITSPLSSLKIRYTNWDRRQPNTKNVDPGTLGMCVSMAAGSKAGLWKVANCADKRRVICTLPREGVTAAPIQPTVTTAGSCPEQWKQVNNKCYKAFSNIDRRKRKTWTEARDYCRSLTGNGNPGNGDLISIHSDNDLSLFTVKVLPGWLPAPVWVGLNDRNSESRWQWSDGSVVDFVVWAENEPNNAAGNEDCVDFHPRTKGWVDSNCNNLRNWICQMDPGVPLIDMTNVTSPAPPTCSENWLYFNGSCYFFSNRIRKSYYQARQYCQTNYSELTSISGIDEQNFLHLSVQKQSLMKWWVGLDMNNGDGAFRWLDGTPLGFQMWAKDEPNYANKQETCVNIYRQNGYWNDDNCGTVLSFICKRSNQTDTSATTVAPVYNPKGFCPADWMEYRGYCIKIKGNTEQNRLNWTDARDDCMADGGNLLSIPNAQFQAFLTSKLVNATLGPLWIGLNDLVQESRFMWRDGTEYSFSNWQRGEPSGPYRSRYVSGGTDQDCVAVVTEKFSVGKWADYVCAENKSYICEMHKSVSIDNLCMDHPKPTWQTMCSDITKDIDCKTLRRRQQKACMKSCKMCDKYVRLPPVVPSIKCPAGWHYWNKECWTLSKNAMTFDAAKTWCTSQKAALATIPDDVSQAWAFSMLADPTENPETALPGGITAWIGMTGDKAAAGGTLYTWLSGWPTHYSNWGRGQPNDNNGTNSGCVAMDGSTSRLQMRLGGFWYDQECNRTLPALCQRTKRKPPKEVENYPGRCPSNKWRPYKGNCYYFIPTTQMASWYQSDFVCRNMDSHLASIHSKDEEDFVMRNSGATKRGYIRMNVWVGLYRNVDDDEFKWTDGTPIDYQNWGDGQPSKGNRFRKELCTELTLPENKWNDNTCNKHGITVCMTPKINFDTTVNPMSTKLASVGGSSAVGIAVGLTIMILLLIVLVFAVYQQKIRNAKSTYSLHLSSVSFRDFLASATSGLRSSGAADQGDRKGLVSSSGDDDHGPEDTISI